VLVRVHATSVNRTDAATLHGTPFLARLATGVRRPKHPILGSEFAGRIEAVGSQVSDLAVGDEVFGFSGATFGAHAEYLVIPADGPVATIPAGLTYDEVASSTEGPHYALSSIEAADLGAGDEVLVYGATGAIGTAAVQLLEHRGATVTAVCDPHGTDLVASLGADVVIDRSTEDFTRTGARFDAILDAVGQTTFRQCRHLLKPGAPYLSTDLGPGWQNLALIPLTRWIGDHRVLIPFPRTCAGTCSRSASCSLAAPSGRWWTAPTRWTTSARPTGTCSRDESSAPWWSPCRDRPGQRDHEHARLVASDLAAAPDLYHRHPAAAPSSVPGAPT
jgi:NADPH:quinone reductase-like Zn-dependent oxidoreductase